MKISKIIKGLKFKNQLNKIISYKKHYEQKIIKQTCFCRLYEISKPIRYIKKSIWYYPKYIFKEIFVDIIQVKLIRINKYGWAIILTDRTTRYCWSKTYIYKNSAFDIIIEFIKLFRT
jgi:hypothetical protein